MATSVTWTVPMVSCAIVDDPNTQPVPNAPLDVAANESKNENRHNNRASEVYIRDDASSVRYESYAETIASDVQSSPELLVMPKRWADWEESEEEEVEDVTTQAGEHTSNGAKGWCPMLPNSYDRYFDKGDRSCDSPPRPPLERAKSSPCDTRRGNPGKDRQRKRTRATTKQKANTKEATTQIQELGPAVAMSSPRPKQPATGDVKPQSRRGKRRGNSRKEQTSAGDVHLKTETRTGQVQVIEVVEEDLLDHEYSLWYDAPRKKVSGVPLVTDGNQYCSELLCMGTFQSLRTYFSFRDSIAWRKLPSRSTIAVSRRSIMPAWEDTAHCNGGRIIIEGLHKHELERLYTVLIIGLVARRLLDVELITVISCHGGGCSPRVAIWVSSFPPNFDKFCSHVYDMMLATLNRNLKKVYFKFISNIASQMKIQRCLQSIKSSSPKPTKFLCGSESPRVTPRSNVCTFADTCLPSSPLEQLTVGRKTAASPDLSTAEGLGYSTNGDDSSNGDFDRTEQGLIDNMTDGFSITEMSVASYHNTWKDKHDMLQEGGRDRSCSEESHEPPSEGAFIRGVWYPKGNIGWDAVEKTWRPLVPPPL